MSDNATTIKVGDREVAPGDLPVHNLCVLAQRAVNHILNNEVASAVKAKREKAEKDGTPFDEDAVQSELYDAKVELILSGVLGQRAAGAPKATPFEKTCREVAWTMIANSPNVKAGKVKLPSGKGSGEARAAMIDQLLGNANLRAKVEAEAKAQIEREAALGAALGE